MLKLVVQQLLEALYTPQDGHRPAACYHAVCCMNAVKHS
jgi:hypothetical protein